MALIEGRLKTKLTTNNANEMNGIREVCLTETRWQMEEFERT